MKKLLFSIAAFLCVSAAWADEYTVGNIEIPQNGTAELVVGLNNTDNQCAGFQFELYLPEGIVVHQVESEYVFTEGSRMSGKGFSTAISYVSGHYQILSYKTTPTAINGTSGTLISIPLEVTGSFTVAQELNASLQVCKITNLDGESFTLNDEIPFTITIGEPDDGRLKFYETSSTLPSYTAGTKANVTMFRTIEANKWSTIVLPFTLSKSKAEAAFGSDVKLAKFNGFETTIDGDLVPTYIKINFVDYTMNSLNGMTGGTPYLIKISEAIESFQADNVTLVGEVNSVSKLDPNYEILTGRFTGTFTTGQIPADGLFISDNKFWYSTGNTNVKAFRAWLQLDPILNKQIELDDSRIILNFVEDEVTGIRDLNNRTDNKFYDLSGQQVKNPAKGLYIQDGKKVIIK